MKPAYLKEIDGLRCISIIGVVLYHLNLSHNNIKIFSGGFLGVDIFFVISGFLITRIIFYKLKNNIFNFKEFYIKRCRRIFPVLIFVCFITLILSYYLLLPFSQKELSKSLISILLINSNLFFYLSGLNYASEDTLLKPLIHTWSLSIEEQFYVLFPILFYLLFKLKKSFNFFFVIFFLSLFSSFLLSYKYPTLNFFLIISRCWELLAGCLLALQFEKSNKNIDKNFNTNLLSFFGIILIILAFIFFDNSMNTLFYKSFTVVLGTVMIIYSLKSKKSNLIRNILKSKSFVYIGLISYSLYLWHYPLFAYARQLDLFENSLFIKFILLILSIVLSIISYNLIEKKFRDINFLSQKTIVLIILFSSLFIILISVKNVRDDNAYVRKKLPEILKNINEQGWQNLKKNDLPCHGRSQDFCSFSLDESFKNIILLGDSHVGILQDELIKIQKEQKFNLTIMTGGRYYINTDVYNYKTKKIEKQFYIEVNNKREFLKKAKPSIIVIGQRYAADFNESFFDNKEGGIEGYEYNYFSPHGVFLKNKKQRQKHLAINLIESLNELIEFGHKIILIYPIPEVGWHIPKKIKAKYLIERNNFETKFLNPKNFITTSYKVFLKRNDFVLKTLNSIENKNIKKIYPQKLFCNTKIKDRCLTHDEKNIYYSDNDHLSKYGSKNYCK